MTKDRALYILNNQLPSGELKYAFRMRCDSNRTTIYKDGITSNEDFDIRRVWDTMPGNTTYYQALVRISKMKEGLMKPLRTRIIERTDKKRDKDKYVTTSFTLLKDDHKRFSLACKNAQRLPSAVLREMVLIFIEDSKVN